MARYKEGLLLLLDISLSMHGVLPEIEKACKMLVQKKFIFGKMDEVGIVVFGAEGTENELEREVGGYEHVVVLRDIKAVDGDAVETIENLLRGTFSGDYLDAIVVGMDMLIKKYGPTNMGKRRLFLITDAQYPIKEPFEGTKEDQVAAICQQINAHGMRLDCIVFRGKSVGAAEQAMSDENDHLLDHFSKNTKAKTVHVYNPTSLYGAVRTRNIGPVTVYRGDLELSSTMKIKEPKEFNRYLRDLYDQFKATDVADFFELLPSKNITLISKTEAPDSDATEEEAWHFPVKRE